MAEFVQFRLQGMLPVLEKMEQTKLFSPRQIKNLIGTLEEREFKIQRPGRTFDDFKAYFISLRSLLGVIKLRREKLGYFHNESEIEDGIRGIITSRFGMAARNFQHEIRFWTFQINFFKAMNWNDRVSDVFNELTALHGVKYPQLWVDASSFEWQRKPGKRIEHARRIIQLGIRNHPNLLLLYVQAFHLELKFVEHTRSSQKQKNALLQTPNGKAILEDLILAKTIYHLAKKECKPSEPNICFEFYKTAKPFPFANALREEIGTDLTHDYGDNEVGWDLSAKIVLAEGGKLTGALIDAVVRIYDRGLQYIPTMKMYDLYLATLKYLHTRAPRKSNTKSKIISQEVLVFQRASRNFKLSEQGYVDWYQLIYAEEEKLSQTSLELPLRNSGRIGEFTSKEIFELAMRKFPENGALHAENVKRKLKHFENKFGSSSKKIKLKKLNTKILTLLANIKEDSSIWSLVFLYIVSHVHSTPKMLQKLISSAPLATQLELKSLYLTHMSWTDMTSARKFYREQAFFPGTSLKFHLDMARYEILCKGSLEPKAKLFRRAKKCYENAVMGFGKDNIELWLTYLSFVRNFSKNSKAATELYARALRELEPSLKEDFINAELKLREKKSKKRSRPN